MIESHTYTDREDWLRIRSECNDVTASVVAALSNLHPWTSRFKLYKEKIGVDVGVVEQNVRMRRGLRIERAVAAMVMEDEPTWKVTPAGVYLRDPDIRLGATPDFFVESPTEFGLGVLQTKITTYRAFKNNWMDDEGALMVPPFILLQTTTEMMLAQADWGAVAVFIDDPWNPMDADLFIFRLDRHAKGEAKIRLDVKQFWRDVADGNEPDPNPKLDSDLVKLLYPGSDELRSIDLSGDNYLPTALADRALAKERIKSDLALIEEIDTYIRGKMGEAEIAFLNGFTITSKSHSVKSYVVPSRMQRPIRVKDHRPKEIVDDGKPIEF